MVYWFHNYGVMHLRVILMHVGAYCIVEHKAQEIFLCSAY